MKLQDFISDSLKQIIGAIEDAQKYSAQHGAKINPKSQATVSGEGSRQNISYDKSTDRYVHHINFDIAVTVSNSKEKNIDGEGKGGIINVVQVGLNLKKNSNETNTEQSRIQFSIPICFPIQEKGMELKDNDERLKDSIGVAKRLVVKPEGY